MKRLLIVLVVLAAVAGISFAVELGGSTAAATAGNDAEQVLEVDQAITVDIDALHFDLSAGYDYKFHTKDYLWDYEVAAKYTLGIFAFGGSIAGNRDVYLGNIKAYADIAYESVGADVDFLFSADQAKAQIFQGAEFSGFFNPGPLEIRIGYMLTPGDGSAVDANTPEALAGGGLFAKVKVTY